MSNQRGGGGGGGIIMTQWHPKFLQIWCGEGVYGLTQPHQILPSGILGFVVPSPSPSPSPGTPEKSWLAWHG